MPTNGPTFGAFLKHMREEKNIKLRELARELGISAPYLIDVERDRRAPLVEERLVDLVKILRLTPQEAEEMYDIIGKQKKLLPLDLNPYVNESPFITSALRIARDLEADEQDWQRFIDDLKQRKNRE